MKKFRSLISVLCIIMLLAGMVIMGYANASSEPSAEASGEASGEASAELPEDAAGLISSAISCKSFSDEAVPDELVKEILAAGIQAPSAQNKQPWQFIVVQDETLKSELCKAPLVIIVAVPEEDYTDGGNSQFAAGTAAESMYLYAQAAGLGAHMYTAPVEMTINISAESKAEYGLQEGYKAAVVLGIGYYTSYADSVSGATVRNDLDTFVTWLG